MTRGWVLRGWFVLAVWGVVSGAFAQEDDAARAVAAPEEDAEPALATPEEVAEEAAEEELAPPMPTDDGPRPERPSGFYFGSYGRINVASNLRGGLGRDSDIVAFNPRIDEGVYFETELRREDDFESGVHSKVVATLAFQGEFFHLDSEFQTDVAVRNLFLQVDHALVRDLSLWVGSRMWRGDDVYLLNFWPLDNLNTVGGGFDYTALEERLDVRFAVGLARPNDPFHRQVSGAIPTSGFLPTEVVVLDRPRTTAALKLTYYPFGRRVETGMKVSLYAEGHYLPSGDREVEIGITESLPSDGGYVIGGQVGGWQVGSRAFVNLFFKWARGLGAYNPLGVPFREGGVTRTTRAREALIAVSANWERGAFGLQAGAYYRNFRDADPNVFERNHLAEGAIDLRPHVWIGEHAGLSFDLSYQAVQMSALDELTGKVVRGGVTKIGFIPFYSPGGRGTYTRPHLRLIYALTLRDDGAQRLYSFEDPRSRQSVEHFLGLGAEWWFDSTSYGR